MSGAETAGRKVRFGVFELDPQTGELRKRGLRMPLQEQPFRVLVSLLERPGELVSRDELRKKLWPDDTFVDFDQGLGTAIRKIREALGDTADNPRFIETLPRRGFRFITPVSWQTSAAVATPSAVLPAPAAHAGGQFLYRRVSLIAIAAFGVVAVAYLLMPSPSTPKVLKIVQLTNDGRNKSPIIVTDGPRIYFSEVIRRGGWSPAVISTSGGEVVPIPVNPLNDSPILDISPDGNRLLLVLPDLVWPGSDGPLWVVPAVGGVPRRLGQLIAHEARWSPDGERILYTKINDHHLYVARADGTESRSLAAVPGQPYYIHWSPDGRHISFTVEDTKSCTVWQASADGTNLRPVLGYGEIAFASSPGRPVVDPVTGPRPSAKVWEDFGPMVEPSVGPRLRAKQYPEAASSGDWTPDGKYFLFEWARGGPDNIWAIRERGIALHRSSRLPMQLTTGPLGIGSPLPSTDGKRIFVVSEEKGPQLQRYDSKLHEWKPFLSGISAEHVDISKDGRWATYISYPDAILFRSKLDGSAKLQLTDHPEQAAMPRFSPDGQVIAYMSRTPGNRWRIRLVSSDGGASQQLTSGDFEETEPSWSPDGRYLALCRSATSKFPVDGPTVIYLIEVGSTKISKIPASGVRYYPRWSPNGRYIAATADDFHTIMLFDLVSHQWITLFKKDSKEPVLYNLSWSPDGQWIYFIDWSPDAPGYYRLQVRDRRIEKVVALPDGGPTIKGTIGGWYGLYNGSLIAVLNQEHGEIYALEWNAP